MKENLKSNIYIYLYFNIFSRIPIFIVVGYIICVFPMNDSLCFDSAPKRTSASRLCYIYTPVHQNVSQCERVPCFHLSWSTRLETSRSQLDSEPRLMRTTYWNTHVNFTVILSSADVSAAAKPSSNQPRSPWSESWLPQNKKRLPLCSELFRRWLLLYLICCYPQPFAASLQLLIKPEKVQKEGCSRNFTLFFFSFSSHLDDFQRPTAKTPPRLPQPLRGDTESGRRWLTRAARLMTDLRESD